MLGYGRSAGRGVPAEMVRATRDVSSREIHSTLSSSLRIDAKEYISALCALTSIPVFGTIYGYVVRQRAFGTMYSVYKGV